MKRRSEACPPAYHWTSVSVAGESSIRYNADSGASTRVGHQHLDRRHVRHDQHGLPRVARQQLVAGAEHPPPYVGRTTRHPAARPSGHPATRRAPPASRSRTSSKVSPSHSPNAHSRNASTSRTVRAQRPRRPRRRSAGSGASATRRRRRRRRCPRAARRRRPPDGPPPRSSSGSRPAGPAEPLLRRVRRLAVAEQHRRGRGPELGVPADQPASRGVGSALRPRRRRRPGCRSSAVLSARRPRLARGPRRPSPRWPAGRRACSAPAAPTCRSPATAAARSRARSASGRMSGCLIFQRPDICSTTSLESIRTSTVAVGSSSRTASSPAIRPRYSATLLRRDADVLGELAQHLAGLARPGRRRRRPPGPGCRGSRRRPRRRTGVTDPDSAVRTRIRRHSSQRMHLVGVGVAQLVDLGVVELEPAAAAPALPQLGGADAALLLADLLVERDQVLGQRARPGWPAGPAAARPRRRSRPWSCRGDAVSSATRASGRLLLGRPARLPALRRLQPLHDLEHDLLEVALPLGRAWRSRAAGSPAPWAR